MVGGPEGIAVLVADRERFGGATEIPLLSRASSVL